ncbi:MAG: twin-arginine translocase subunit TatC, partial [Flavobacteriales bacterium]
MEKIGKEQSFLDHLEILRWHLIRSAAAIFLFAIMAFLNPAILFDTIIFASKDPGFVTYTWFCWLSNSLGLGDAFCIMETLFELNNFTMPGQFSTHIVSSIVAGFVISFPYIIWEIWRFIGPALSDGERKYSRGIVFYVSLLFILGILFGYYFVSPLSVQFLGNYQISAQVANQISLNSFISIVTSV